MKKTIVVIMFITLFSCKPEQPVLMSDATYKITKDVFEKYPGRYEVKVETTKALLEEHLKTIAEWIRETHGKNETILIFYYIPGKTSAYARIDYPKYIFEKFEPTSENRNI